MDELISRQAAIDICRAPHMRNADCSDFEMAIMMLPPAQPELPIKKKCTICPHCDNCDVNDDGTIAQPEPCDDPRADVYYLAEKIGIHRLYALVVELRGEPEPCEDTVSRQGAIDAIRDNESENYITINNLIDKDVAVALLENLPSAQPERTCVNCGRTVNNGGWYADGRTRCPIEEHYALPKDGYCHLWEKRNVTDDDYPERRTDE